MTVHLSTHELGALVEQAVTLPRSAIVVSLAATIQFLWWRHSRRCRRREREKLFRQQMGYRSGAWPR